MKDCKQFYINGQWVNPSSDNTLDVINPATEQVCAQITLGDKADVDAATAAATQAFASYSVSSKGARITLLENIIAEYKVRYNDMASAISEEMGAPISLSMKAQAAAGLVHFETALQVLKDFSFEEKAGNSQVFKEPIGVCGLITPWNWPMNQVLCKVAPALATGCTVVLKPSEIAPLSSHVLAEIIHKAGVPAGVFNMVNGDGAGVGTLLASHSQIDMVSFTGSTRAGTLVAQNAAPTVKRVSQELGGKSANIILDDADLAAAVAQGAMNVFLNSGQSCNAGTRMLVPADKLAQAAEIAAQTAASLTIGDPSKEDTAVGPVVSQLQFDKIQTMIKQGIDAGATVVCGGLGKPEGIEQGYFVKPTVFSDVNNQMSIAREEIFGPVLALIPYNSDQEAIDIANDNDFGLAGYIQGKDPKRLAFIASRIRAGNININGQMGDANTPFGGYKQSGNGRERGAHGFAEFLETKAVTGLL